MVQYLDVALKAVPIALDNGNAEIALGWKMIVHSSVSDAELLGDVVIAKGAETAVLQKRRRKVQDLLSRVGTRVSHRSVQPKNLTYR